MMGILTNKKCIPCEGGISGLSKVEAVKLLRDLGGWNLSPNAKSIRVEYIMKNFQSAVDLINQITTIAESKNHHPDIHLTNYRKLAVELSTHSIGGLSENDFIVAAKINELPKQLKTAAK